MSGEFAYPADKAGVPLPVTVVNVAADKIMPACSQFTDKQRLLTASR